jgi:hypothetical protein
MRKHIGIAVALFAVVSGTGIALAQDGEPPEEVPESEVPLDEVDEVDEVDDEVVVEDEVEDPAPDDADDPAAGAAAPTDNHGAVVSQAAHECPTGPGGVHGECVSAVARDHDQDGVPDHGPGSSDGEDDVEAQDAEDAPGNGNGNGRGQGRGHD